MVLDIMKIIQNLIVGFIFFGAFFLVGYFTVVSKEGPFAKKGKEVIVFFDDASGLTEGSNVSILGVDAGRVKKIELVSVDESGKIVSFDDPSRIGERVAVILNLTKEVIFYENYKVNIKNASLFAGRIVAVYPGSATSIPEDASLYNGDVVELQKNDIITIFKFVHSSTNSYESEVAVGALLEAKASGKDFFELQGKSSGDPIGALSELISENRVNVRSTIKNIRDITDKINQGEGTLGLLINDDALHRNTSDLITDADDVVEELRNTFEDAREQAPVTSFLRAVLTAF